MVRQQIIQLMLATVLFLFTQPFAYAQTKKVQPLKSTVAKAAPNASAADIAMGKQLISKSGCLACHKLDVKLVGPAYIDVARKYPATAANYTYLTDRIIKGGSGVWGQIAMPPNPAVSVADAKKIVAYILSIK